MYLLTYNDMNQLQNMLYKNNCISGSFCVHFIHMIANIVIYMNLKFEFAYIDSLNVDIFVSLHFECLMLNALCFSIYAIFVSRFRC